MQCECSLITSIDEIDKKVAQAIGEGFAAFLCCLKDQRSAFNRYHKYTVKTLISGEVISVAIYSNM